MAVEKKTPSAMVAIFGSSPIPSHRIKSGSSAIFGIGNSAEIKVMPRPPASVERPMAKPTMTPAIVPMIQPEPIRITDQDTCCHSAPEVASLVIATAIADGAGRNSGLAQPALPASCHSAMTSASAIQPEARPAVGIKPAPRNATGRTSVARSSCGARSSMLDLALGIDRLLADQRPQIVLQREQFAARIDRSALGARHRDFDDLPDAAGTARQHHDAIGEPHRFLEIMRDI